MGLVVPLPQDAPAIPQLIGGVQRGIGVLRAGRGQIQHLGDGIHHGPAIYPAEGHHHRDASHRAVILEEQQRPGAIVQLYRATLGHTGEAAIQIKLHEFATLESIRQTVGTVAAHGAHAALSPMDVEQVVPAVMLDEMAALPAEHDVLAVLKDDAVKAAFFLGGEIVGQLCQADGTVAVGHVDTAIIIKEQAGVVPEAVHLLTEPGALGIIRGIVVGMLGVVGGKHHMELRSVVLKGGGPHAPGVDVAAVHALMGGFAEDVIDIGAVLPVHHVVGAQELSAGEHVHGGGNHVIGIPHADNVRVGIIGINDGVDGRHGIPPHV